MLHPSLSPGRHTEGRWETLFQPVTNCTTPGMDWATALPPFVQSKEDDADYLTAQAVVAGIVDGGAGALKSDPPSVPPDVLRLALRFSSRPEVWWSGLLASFLLRPSEQAAEGYRRFAREHGLELPMEEEEEPSPLSSSAAAPSKSPTETSQKKRRSGRPPPSSFAALHVRRTDKVTSPDGGKHAAEADETELERYFEALDAWTGVARAARRKEEGDGNGEGEEEEEGAEGGAAAAVEGEDDGNSPPAPPGKEQDDSGSNDPRPTVFVATDDPAVLSEIKAAPYARRYRIVGDASAAASASRATRWGPDSLRGVAADLFFLSRADVLVGTFSSQVSRLAYEMRQVVGPATAAADAALRFHSVDAR